MNIKSYIAADMRTVMRAVREEQGPDAVILSTHRLDSGDIEVVAAVDYDEALMQHAARSGTPLPPALPMARRLSGTESYAAILGETGPGRPDTREARDVVVELSTASETVSRKPVEAMAKAKASAPTPTPVAITAWPESDPVREDIWSLRELLERQLSALSWNDLERHQPKHARVLRELTKMGLEADVTRRLVADLPETMTTRQLRPRTLEVLTQALVVNDPERLDEGGVIALLGPTGVGKTTTLAKLAARAAKRHGADRVALVSTDHYRIGAAAQLDHYAHLLGVRVYPAYDAASLRNVLDLLKDHHTVLVDTAGLAGSDPRLKIQMDTLAAIGNLRVCLVLAANAQVHALDAAVRAYLPLEPQGVIVTKLDEAPNLGAVLSVVLRHHLALDHVTDGQRVPEDLHDVDAKSLVRRAAEGLRAEYPDVEDGVMAERFGLVGAGA